MRIALARLFLGLAWDLVPRDWAFYRLDSLERSIYDSIRRAVIDADHLAQMRRWDSLRKFVTECQSKGTPR